VTASPKTASAPSPVGAKAKLAASSGPPVTGGAASTPDLAPPGDAADVARSPGGVSSSPRTWVLELPAGMRLLSLNSRMHWAEKGRITRDLRKAAWACAKAARVPPLERARVTVEYQPPQVSRRRDLDNVATASGKPCLDGALTDARVLADDSPQYLTEITYRLGEPYPRGRLVITITEVTG